MKTLKRFFILILFTSLTHSLLAQKKPFYNELEEVLEAAYTHLDFSMSEGELKKWAEKREAKGAYTMKITIKNKGEVVTVQALNREGGDIPTQNALKSFIKEYRFPFKMPKERSFQFEYEFKFN